MLAGDSPESTLALAALISHGNYFTDRQNKHLRIRRYKCSTTLQM